MAKAKTHTVIGDRIYAPGEELPDVAEASQPTVASVPEQLQVINAKLDLLLQDAGIEVPKDDDADEAESESDGSFDIAELADVFVKDALAYVGEDRERAEAVLEAERAGKARSTLVAPLEKLLSDEHE